MNVELTEAIVSSVLSDLTGFGLLLRQPSLKQDATLFGTVRKILEAQPSAEERLRRLEEAVFPAKHEEERE